LQRFNRGIAILDTIVTLAPLEGLFGTVTGMIRAFGLLGASELGAPTAITGGIAEALIATAFGLLIAMLALLPFNYLNARLEQARQEIETASAKLELLLLRTEKNAELIG
jgi:biopolymer transport protein ExbB